MRARRRQLILLWKSGRALMPSFKFRWRTMTVARVSSLHLDIQIREFVSAIEQELVCHASKMHPCLCTV